MHRNHNYRRFNRKGVDKSISTDEVQVYIDEMLAHRTRTIEHMVTILEDSREIFSKMLERGAEEQAQNPSNPLIAPGMEALAIMNERIRVVLETVEKLFSSNFL